MYCNTGVPTVEMVVPVILVTVIIQRTAMEAMEVGVMEI
jgi:hypothetical protein